MPSFSGFPSQVLHISKAPVCPFHSTGEFRPTHADTSDVGRHIQRRSGSEDTRRIRGRPHGFGGKAAGKELSGENKNTKQCNDQALMSERGQRMVGTQYVDTKARWMTMESKTGGACLRANVMVTRRRRCKIGYRMGRERRSSSKPKPSYQGPRVDRRAMP